MGSDESTRAGQPEPLPEPVVDPLAQWRHLPAPPRREDLITSQSVAAAGTAGDPAGDPGHEFMLRHAGG